MIDAVRTGDARAILGVLEAFLPERCRSGSFELDYCVGYGAGALAKQVLTGGAGAAAAMGRINRLADKVPGADVLRKVCGRSFAADTGVLMADGSTKPIGEVGVGDLVWATDPESGEGGPRQVEAVWPHGDRLVELYVVVGARLA